MRRFLNDQYANYVVQRALQVADDKQGLRLVQAIRPHMSSLASSNASCARRVSSRVVRRFPSLMSDKLFSSYFGQKDKSFYYFLRRDGAQREGPGGPAGAPAGAGAAGTGAAAHHHNGPGAGPPSDGHR
eukprot:CAMPEP_0202052976 /NCGR_PEP_ID=MMETSP0963-20130614/5590_1 /ASSEMBLY_ACC=CAM_ASM_000494 /TAXON_ID=4773 /ORGANISM="Schizochytrium aggregatum, Strain ATCC28209" /LENGTH=128 /DNA_ID=CAMNT_0048618283 /DNA_START=24 /DNA_END=410 /DNA_ORIENTATION=+